MESWNINRVLFLHRSLHPIEIRSLVAVHQQYKLLSSQKKYRNDDTENTDVKLFIYLISVRGCEKILVPVAAIGVVSGITGCAVTDETGVEPLILINLSSGKYSRLLPFFWSTTILLVLESTCCIMSRYKRSRVTLGALLYSVRICSKRLASPSHLQSHAAYILRFLNQASGLTYGSWNNVICIGLTSFFCRSLSCPALTASSNAAWTCSGGCAFLHCYSTDQNTNFITI